MNLTPQQLKKLEKIKKLLDSGNVGIITYLLDLEDKLENEIPNFLEVLKRVKGDDGDTYELTDSDRKDIANQARELLDDEGIASKVLNRLSLKEIAKIASSFIEVPLPKEVDVKALKKALKQEILDEMPEPVNGENGKDANEEAIIEKIEDDLEEDLPQFGTQFRDGLELLIGDDRLDKKAIKGLDDYEEVSRLAREKPRVIGGGKQNLYQLNDVNIQSPSNNHVLKYNSTTNLWENGTVAGGLTSFTSPNDSITIGGSLTDPTVDLKLSHENTWTIGQVFNDPDVTYTPQPSPSLSITFTPDASGFLAIGNIYAYAVYAYYYDGTNYAYDNVGISASQSDPNDSQNYFVDVTWSTATDANGYLLVDTNTGDFINVGNVTTYQVTPSTTWTGSAFFPALTPNSIVVPGHPVWANKTQDWGTADFNVLAMGLSGTNHLQFRWKYTGVSGSGNLRFESDDGTLRAINANIYADTIVATSSISGYIYPTTLGQNYIAYGSSGGYVTGGSNFIFNPSTTRLLVSNAGITPQNQLHMHYSTATAVYAQFTNSATGSTSADGFRLGIDSAAGVELRNYEATAINIYTQNILRANIPSGGVTQLNVYGFVRGAVSSIATTSTDGLVAGNDASATSGVPVQRAPRLRFYGHVWNGTSTKVESWIVEPASQTSGATPTSVLAFGREYDLGTGYTYHMNLASSGNLSVGLGVTAGTLGRFEARATSGSQIVGSYDGSNYWTATTSSAGAVTFDAVGASAGFTFSDSVTMADAKDIIFNTTTGTKIGTATSQKLGFWNATPIVQPTTSVGSATLVSPGAGTNIKSDDTFDGYTLQQVVKALRNAGLLA